MRIVNSPLFKASAFLSLFTVAIMQMTSCTKEELVEVEVVVKDTVIVHDTTYYDIVCPVRGTFVGTSTPNGGGPSSNSIYTFEENHFVVGRHELNQEGVSFGGFRNTCDSVVWSVFYTVNDSYYLLKGKFSNNRNTISGTFQNLNTTSDFGTFTMSK